MASVVVAGTNERRFCWEQVLRTNRLFRISHAFAPTDQASRLLPLYALFSAVEEIGIECSDEDVARRKLGWWRNECSQLNTRGSDHPILRELLDSGAQESLDQGRLTTLVSDAESRLDPAAPADADQLRAICMALSRPQIELEMALWGGAPSPQLVGTLGLELGLAQLLRESARRETPRRYWWVPLSLLARHALTRRDLAAHPATRPVRALFAELLSEGADSALGNAGWSSCGELSQPAARHLFVIGHLRGLSLRRLHRRSPDEYPREMGRVGLRQLYQAWNAARTFTAARGVGVSGSVNRP